MRFETRDDRWLVVLLVIAGGASWGLAFFSVRDRSAPMWLAALTCSIWIVALSACRPQYYELRDDGLWIRQGWRRLLLPYDSLVEIQSVTSAMSAPVFSTQRLVVVTRDGRRILIAVRDEDRFLEEVARRASQLERRDFGLATPLAPRSIV